MKIIPASAFDKPISELTSLERIRILSDAHLRSTVNDIIYGYSGERPILPKNELEKYGDSLQRADSAVKRVIANRTHSKRK